MKVAVGCADPAALAERQAARAAAEPPLRVWTRSWPRRAAEVLEGGSLYWVVGGAIRCRQRILAIEHGMWDDSTPCAEIHVDPRLVAVAPRPMRPFQGWRYLEAAEAPPDAEGAASAPGLPPRLLRELRALGLG
ncbi:MAG: DUF1489 domain-containing protein [Acetobacteraceae bacterium]|nr:DUF1489 domain-containing protein [Acetobacteraceae bacterium]